MNTMLRSSSYRLSMTLGFMALLLTAATAQKVEFATQVLPILKNSCVKCHQAPYKDKLGLLQEPGSGLRLDGRYWIEKGSDYARVIVPGQVAKSSLYDRITLDPDHEDIMPAEGDPLSKKEQGILRQWIAEGAEFGSWVGAKGPKGESSLLPRKVTKSDSLLLIEELSKGLSNLPSKTLEKARGANAQIFRVHPKSPLLRVQYISNEASVSDGTVKDLAPLSRHITHLNLAKTKITNAALSSIGKMLRLTRLDLNNTGISDRGLFHLTALKDLRYLNLYGTKVSDQGIDALGRLKKLEALYLWKSQVSTPGVARLRKLLPNTKINYKLILPKPSGRTQNGRRRGRGKKRRKV